MSAPVPPTDKLEAIFARKRRELAARGPRVAEHPRPPDGTSPPPSPGTVRACPSTSSPR
ncbi:hypothetical protein ACN28S_47030 [Cystobacter fuscus]